MEITRVTGSVLRGNQQAWLACVNLYGVRVHAALTMVDTGGHRRDMAPICQAAKVDQLGAARPLGRRAMKLRSVPVGGYGWVSTEFTKMLSILGRVGRIFEVASLH